MNIKKTSIAIIFIIVCIIINFRIINNQSPLPLIAIANYGSHSSLNASIKGIKEELTRQGFLENKKIRYDITNVGFDPSLIPQMITKLKNQKPAVIVVLTTPIAQFAKGSIKDIPLVYSAITDPIEAGLLKQKYSPDGNMTGSSDQQDLTILLEFAKKIIPNAKRIGLLYATAESNDIALVKMMKKAAKKNNMEVLVIPIDQARDIPIRMHNFKGKVDFIYVGSSGPIQPTLPVIVAEANKMNIPILNFDEESVKNGLSLASFGVNYKKVGFNTGKIVAKILNKISISKIKPLYPTANDHDAYINHSKSQEFNRVKIPKNLNNIIIVK